MAVPCMTGRRSPRSSAALGLLRSVCAARASVIKSPSQAQLLAARAFSASH